MKKLNLVAAAALSLVSASTMAQSTVTLYGLIDAAVSVTTKQAAGSVTRVEAGQLATSRWGIRGSEDLGGGMKAFFNLESTLINDTGASGLGFGGPAGAAPTLSAVPTPAEVAALTAYRTAQAGGASTSLFDRAALVGLSGGFGSVSVGRQNILGVDSIGLADPIGLSHPGSGNPNVAFSALNQGSIYNGFGTNGGGAALRQNNSIRYLTPVFGNAFGGALMYGAGEQAGNASKNSYQGISGYYRSGNSGAALAYAKLKNAADSDTPDAVGRWCQIRNQLDVYRERYLRTEQTGFVQSQNSGCGSGRRLRGHTGPHHDCGLLQNEEHGPCTGCGNPGRQG